jgi:thiol-disulfide isomerase/thioredoxin
MPQANRPPSPRKFKTPSRRPQRSKLPVVPLVIGFTALLAVVAVVASRGGDRGNGENTGLKETRPVTVTGDALAPHGEGGDAAVGALAPTLEGAAFDGAPLSIGADGRPKILVFLAHWCPHCQNEVPILAAWLAENGPPAEVDLYGVASSTDPDRPNYPPSAWLERENWSVPTLADAADNPAAQAFGLSSFPYFVAVDAENRVVARASGELTVRQWEALIDEARA